MLRQLSIRDVVLIDQLDLEFEPGLGVLTGETGAGKSILLDSLGLALGVRADTGLVRQGEAQASVTAVAIVTVRRTTSTFAGVKIPAKFCSVNSGTTSPLKSSSRRKLLASSVNSEPR